jgi:superfamily I DNA/RNA helicase
LRLLYVGITRARKELIVTWNTCHVIESAVDRAPKQMALPFAELLRWWEEGSRQ